MREGGDQKEEGHRKEGVSARVSTWWKVAGGFLLENLEAFNSDGASGVSVFGAKCPPCARESYTMDKRIMRITPFQFCTVECIRGNVRAENTSVTCYGEKQSRQQSLILLQGIRKSLSEDTLLAGR